MTSSRIPVGMGIFLCTQGVCATVGILTGEKYSSRNRPRSASVHASACSLVLRTCCASLHSSGQRKSYLLMLSASRRSCVSRMPGVNGGGSVGSGGRERRGSSGLRRMIRKSSGSDAATGWTFFAAFLYARVRVGGVGLSGDWLKRMLRVVVVV